MSQGAVRAELRVFGRVQGVGFRWATEHEARRLGLRGYVRNLDDGSVEIVAEGAPDAVERLVTWAHQGPRLAAVAHVQEEHGAATGDYSDFTSE